MAGAVKDGTYGFAIVGCGVISSFHAESIASIPNARLRAVVDAVPGRAERFAAETGVEGYAHLEPVLGRSDVDIVCACVPSGLHAEIGVQAAAAGKHVVVEKPIDVSLEAADRLIDACRRHRVKLAVISQHRFDAGVQRLHGALTAGRFGRLLLGDMIMKRYRSPQYYESASWRATWELDGGGALMNQGIHYVDLLQWLMGPVARVTARTATVLHRIPVEDVALALLTFANGAVGVIQASTAVYPGFLERLEITGTGGTAIVEDGAVVAWEFVDAKGDVGPYGDKVRWVTPPPEKAPDQAARVVGHRTQLLDLLEAVATDRDPVITGEEARKPLEIILAIYQSARTGREVMLPR